MKPDGRRQEAALDLLRKAAGDGDLDFLREGLAMLTQLVMDAEVTAQSGATHGERVPERRLTQRNGYRERRGDTRVGAIDLQIPKLRDGTYFPSLLEPRRRAEPTPRRASCRDRRAAGMLGVGPRRPIGPAWIASRSSCSRQREGTPVGLPADRGSRETW